MNQNKTKKPKLPPVIEGQNIKLKIELDGHKNRGIAKHKGYLIFVENATKNWEGNCKITAVYPKYAFAEKQEEQ